MKLQDSHVWLNSISARFTGKDLRLDRVKLLLRLMGNPYEHFKSIHVAGTSGKGSTCTFISSILAAHGYRTGLNLSPHVEKINERIQINNVEISCSEFEKLAEAVYPFWQEAARTSNFGPPTFFETITAMAFEHFASNDVDYAVVEVGLGGTFDATNVLTPATSVICPVSLDHIETLGHSVEKIAAEKAGIIKQGVAVVTSAIKPALGVIRQKATQQNCSVKALGEDFNFNIVKNSLKGLEFDYLSQSFNLYGIESNLLGSHQALNASTAITTCSVVENLEKEKVRKGVASAFIPARLEVVFRNPLVIIDGAHNPEKIRATVDFLQRAFGLANTQIVMGIVNYRDPAELISAIAPVASEFFFVSPQCEKTFHDVELLCSIARQINPAVQASAIEVEEIPRLFSADKATCITGSLYLAGIAKPMLAVQVPLLGSNRFHSNAIFSK